jgi:hypothetical protein
VKHLLVAPPLQAPTEPAAPAPAAPPAPAPPAAQPPAAPPATPAAPAAPPAPKAPEPGKQEGAAPAAPTPPEKYELKVPEGGHIDGTDLVLVEKIARTQGLSNADAQALLDDHADALAAQSARFLADTTADSMYGGAKLEQTQKLARAALDRLRPKGTPQGDALRTLLDKSGYGNHLAVISLLADIGKAMAEDSPIASVGASSGGAAKNDAADLYDHPSSRALAASVK